MVWILWGLGRKSTSLQRHRTVCHSRRNLLLRFDTFQTILNIVFTHNNDVIMTKMASQVTSLTVVYSNLYSHADQSKHQSSASLAFVWGIHRGRWIPRTKGQLRGKCFHLMTSSRMGLPLEWHICNICHSCRWYIRYMRWHKWVIYGSNIWLYKYVLTTSWLKQLKRQTGDLGCISFAYEASKSLI